METISIEGIIVKSLPFQEHDRILTLFTPERGLLKAVLKGAYSRQKGTAAAQPLTHVEVVCKRGRGDLWVCREISLLNTFFFLRNDYSLLDASCKMLHAIGRSHWEGAPSPRLYELLLAYLKNLSSAADPYIFSSSFYLKLLRSEGLLHLHDVCQICGEPLETWHLAEGETLCAKHAPYPDIVLSAEEAATLALLATTRSLKTLTQMQLKDAIGKKIEALFQARID